MTRRVPDFEKMEVVDITDRLEPAEQSDHWAKATRALRLMDGNRVVYADLTVTDDFMEHTEEAVRARHFRDHLVRKYRQLLDSE
jgi:hypothetical protein